MTVAANNGFFIPQSRLTFIDNIVSQTSQSCLIAIDGPAGMGKTTVLEELLTSSLPDANKCYLTAAPSLNEIQIRSRIIEQFFGNVLFDPEKPLLNTFLEFNHQVPLMLAIDNGHYLPGQIIGEILQVVAELKNRGYHMVALIAYDKSLSKTIGSINSALLSHYSVPALSFDESYSLLNRYFQNVPSASNARIKRWIDAAKGSPIQLLAFDEEKSLGGALSKPMNLKLWGATILLLSLLVALGLYFYRGAIDDKSSGPVAITEIVNNVKEGFTAKQWSKPEVQKQIELQPKKVNVATAEDIFGVIEQATLTQREATANAQDIVEAETPTFNHEKGREITISGESLETIEHEVFETSVADVKSDSMKDNEEATKTPELVKETLSEDVSAEAEPQSQLMHEKIGAYIVDNQSLMALPKDKYVLQLTAVSTESTLEQYLSSKELEPELTRIYKIERNNADWWVVTYGVFDSIRAARETAKSVDNNAWAKSVSVVQQQISVYQQSLSQ